MLLLSNTAVMQFFTAGVVTKGALCPDARQTSAQTSAHEHSQCSKDLPRSLTSAQGSKEFVCETVTGGIEVVRYCALPYVFTERKRRNLNVSTANISLYHPSSVPPPNAADSDPGQLILHFSYPPNTQLKQKLPQQRLCNIQLLKSHSPS
ncbi:hypothetical protein WMY93_026131 [Mugilogobius chulae]|uniref:Uncharacterized protein n=1 Tax=Mugilogobius chulae TaxID=88201 RepID=A0AAW0N2B4_9GOBI